MHPLFLTIPAIVCAVAFVVLLLSLWEDFTRPPPNLPRSAYVVDGAAALLCGSGVLACAVPVMAWVVQVLA